MSPDPAGRTIRWSVFLKDVLICSLGAYGGPEAHYGIFAEQLVSRKRYLTEEELMELVALTSMLPGPSSTQTIAAILIKNFINNFSKFCREIGRASCRERV